MNENTNVIEPALLTLEQACNYCVLERHLAENCLKSMNMNLLYELEIGYMQIKHYWINGLMIKPGLKRGITK